MKEVKRRGLLLLMAGVVGISFMVRFLQTPLLIWNTTNSLPKGIYRIESGYEVGDIIAFDIPVSILPLVRERGWIPDYDRLLKRVVAIEGDEVCFRDKAVFINREYAGERRAIDSQSRPMPWLSGCHVLNKEQVWVMLKGQPLSLDSRYFGAVDMVTVYGKASPVVTY